MIGSRWFVCWFIRVLNRPSPPPPPPPPPCPSLTFVTSAFIFHRRWDRGLITVDSTVTLSRLPPVDGNMTHRSQRRQAESSSYSQRLVQPERKRKRSHVCGPLVDTTLRAIWSQTQLIGCWLISCSEQPVSNRKQESCVTRIENGGRLNWMATSGGSNYGHRPGDITWWRRRTRKMKAAWCRVPRIISLLPATQQVDGANKRTNQLLTEKSDLEKWMGREMMGYRGTDFCGVFLSFSIFMFCACVATSAGFPGNGRGGSRHIHGELFQQRNVGSTEGAQRVCPILQPQPAENGPVPFERRN